MERNALAPFRARGVRLSWRWVLAAVLCVGGGVAVGVLLAPRVPFTFKVTARIIFQRGREQSTLRPELNLLSPVGRQTWEPRETELRDFVELLESPAVLRPTIEQLCAEDPAFSYETAGGRGGILGMLTGVVASLMRDLGIHGQDERLARSVEAWATSFETDDVWATPIVDLICYTAEREHGERFLQRLIENYKTVHMQVYGPASWFDFVQRQLEEMEGRYAEAENALSRFRLQTGTASFAREKNDLLRRRIEAQESYRELRAQEAGLAAAVEAIETALARLPFYAKSSAHEERGAAHRELETDLLREEQQLARLLTAYPEMSPFVLRSLQTRSRVAGLLDEYPEWIEDASLSSSRAAVYEMLRQELSERGGRLAAVRAEAVETLATVEGVSATLARHEELRARDDALAEAVDQARRDVERARWSARVAEQSRVLDEAELTNVRVLKPPEAARWPESVAGYPHRLAIVYAGGFAGLMLWGLLFMLRNVVREDVRMALAPVQPRSPA